MQKVEDGDTVRKESNFSGNMYEAEFCAAENSTGLAEIASTQPGPGRYSQKNVVGVSGPLPKTCGLFMTKICGIPYAIYDLTKNLKPYL